MAPEGVYDLYYPSIFGFYFFAKYLVLDVFSLKYPQISERSYSRLRKKECLELNLSLSLWFSFTRAHAYTNTLTYYCIPNTILIGRNSNTQNFEQTSNTYIHTIWLKLCRSTVSTNLAQTSNFLLMYSTAHGSLMYR